MIKKRKTSGRAVKVPMIKWLKESLDKMSKSNMCVVVGPTGVNMSIFAKKIAYYDDLFFGADTKDSEVKEK